MAAGETDEREIVESFLEFVDENSRAIDEEYEKAYTIDDLCGYVDFFIKTLKDNKHINKAGKRKE